VNEATSMVWGYFLKSKTQKKMLEFILIMKTRDQEIVKFMRCDNSPKNKRLAEGFEKKRLKVNFESTAPGTTEENEKDEGMYETLWGRAQAVLNMADLSVELRSGLWTECANYISQMHNAKVKAGKVMYLYVEFYEKKPTFLTI
jgi:hypothetical protein